MRCKGALLTGEAITSLQAPGFLHSRDKLSLFTTRILVSGYPLLRNVCHMLTFKSSVFLSSSYTRLLFHYMSSSFDGTYKFCVL